MKYLITQFKNNRITNLNQLQQLLNNPRTPARKYQTVTSLRDENTPNLAVIIPQEVRNRINTLYNTLELLNQAIPENEKHEHFTVFQIPKASGGFRTIKAPNDDLKTAYSQVAHDLSAGIKMLVHDNAYAYIPSRNVYDAVARHQKNESQWFLKLDIEKFFDNCSTQVIENMLGWVYPLCFYPELIKELAKFATWENQLPQGTPLSPILTNILMIPFDYFLSKKLEKQGFIYTRYADDILISHKDSFAFSGIIGQITHLFEALNLPFKIKEEKTRYGNRSGRNWNLGLMLNKDNNITLGHKFKKQIKIILFQTATGRLPDHDPHNIGLFSYLKQIEPRYYKMLDEYAMRKYHRSIVSILNP